MFQVMKEAAESKRKILSIKEISALPKFRQSIRTFVLVPIKREINLTVYNKSKQDY